MNIVPIKVELIDKMGDDVSVVNAARVSFAKESEWKYSPEGKVLGDLPTKTGAFPLVMKIKEQAEPQVPKEEAVE